MFGSPSLVVATFVTGFVAGLLWLLVEAVRGVRHDPRCICAHTRRAHDMTWTTNTATVTLGPCKTCECRAFIEDRSA